MLDPRFTKVVGVFVAVSALGGRALSGVAACHRGNDAARSLGSRTLSRQASQCTLGAGAGQIARDAEGQSHCARVAGPVRNPSHPRARLPQQKISNGAGIPVELAEPA